MSGKSYIYILLFTLIFLPLESILEKLLSIETILKPYRIGQILIILLIISRGLWSKIKLKSIDWTIISFVSIGLIVSFIDTNNVPVQLQLLTNWVLLFGINYMFYIIIRSTHFTRNDVKYIFFSLLVGNIINLFFIINSSYEFEDNYGIIRNSGMISNPNGLGFQAVLLLIFMFYSLKIRVVQRWFIIPILLFIIFLIDKSGSRANFFLLLFVLLLSAFPRITFANSLKISFLILMIFIFSNKILQSLEVFSPVKRQFSKEDREQTDVRIYFLAASGNVVNDSFGLGIGISQFQVSENFQKYMYPVNRGFALERKRKGEGLGLHSNFLQAIVEFGLIGMLLLLVFYYKALKISYTRKGQLSSQLLIVIFIILYSATHTIFLNPFAWLFLGLANNSSLQILVRNIE